MKLPTKENMNMRDLTFNLDYVIQTLAYARDDEETSYQAASLIRVCINQLVRDIKTINDTFGSDWPENKL
jgi:hypothetical protein